MKKLSEIKQEYSPGVVGLGNVNIVKLTQVQV